MASRSKAGGPIPGRTVAFTPVADWVDAAIGNLVIVDTSHNYNVDECADGEVPFGIVRAVNKDLDVVTVEMLTGGCIARLPYNGGVGLGDSVVADHTAGPGIVAAGGTFGQIIAIDIVSGYVDVLFV